MQTKVQEDGRLHEKWKRSAQSLLLPDALRPMLSLPHRNQYDSAPLVLPYRGRIGSRILRQIVVQEEEEGEEGTAAAAVVAPALSARAAAVDSTSWPKSMRIGNSLLLAQKKR